MSTIWLFNRSYLMYMKIYLFLKEHLQWHNYIIDTMGIFLITSQGDTLLQFYKTNWKGMLVILLYLCPCQAGEICRNSNTQMFRNKRIDDDDVDLLQLDVQELNHRHLFHSKNTCPSSSLLQDKHLPFTPSPLRLNIFRLFVILLLTQLYR